MQKLGDTTTLTTKDLYRQSIIRQKERIEAATWETFSGEHGAIPIRLLGIWGMAGQLKTSLMPYINDEKAKKEYEDKYNEIDMDFQKLFDSNANEETYRKFMGDLNDWLGLLTLYFADVGIVPKGRVIGYAGDMGIDKIHTLEEAIEFIKNSVKHVNKLETKENYEEMVKKLDVLEVDYAECPPGHSTSGD